MKKLRYSKPKIYIPKKNGRSSVEPGDLWHVYFYWRTEPDGKLDRKFSYQKGINRLKTVSERKAAANALSEALLTSLKRGWNPVTKTATKAASRGDFMSVGSALDYAFKIKKRSGKKKPTLDGYEFHLNRFKEWALKSGFIGADIKKFTIEHFYQFLDYLRFEYTKEDGQPLSGTSVNNHKRTLSAFFTTLKNERIIYTNFIKDIPNVDQDPVNNKAFTSEEIEEIKKKLLKEDPYLIYFISFMIYPLLRPREICRLQVKDINTKNWFLSVETKTDRLSYRRIIDKIKPTIKKLGIENQPATHYLFSNLNKPHDWGDASLKTRVDHFGHRFRKIKKELGFGRDYGLYSFRHTAIMDLYNSMVSDGMGEQEILSKLMPITQHRSVEGIKNYLRQHKTSMPADHSDIYTIDF